MKKTKILQVIGGLNRGGAETMLMNIYRQIDAKYEFVFVIYTKDDAQHDYEQEVLANGNRIIRLALKRVSNPLTFYMDLLKIMKKEQFDCIHCHTLFNSGVAVLAAKHCGIPIRITHSHSSGIMKKNNIVNRIYFCISRYLIEKNTTVQVACDEKSGEYLFGEKFNGTILHNGIDIDKFSPNTPAMTTLHPDLVRTDILKMAAISSFYEVKNHTFMIKIADCLNKRGIDFRLYFVGRGPLENDLRKEIAAYGLEEKIIFLGVIDNVHELLPAIDVVLMPSLYEGIPVSLIEAQSSGTPAVISNRISKDVDLGLDLLTFLDINDNYEIWADIVLTKSHKEKNIQVIREKLCKSGYSVKDNTGVISSIYDGKRK